MNFSFEFLKIRGDEPRIRSRKGRGWLRKRERPPTDTATTATKTALLRSAQSTDLQEREASGRSIVSLEDLSKDNVALAPAQVFKHLPNVSVLCV
jgi:hypothetical protein